MLNAYILKVVSMHLHEPINDVTNDNYEVNTSENIAIKILKH